MVDPNLVIGTAKTFADGLLEFLKTRPSYEQKQFEKLFELENEIDKESTRADSDFDQVLHLREIRNNFLNTVISELKKAMEK
jgi:hypothetical protein